MTEFLSGAASLSHCDVFLSSAFGGFMDVRDDIVALDPKRIWAIEVRRPDLDTRKGAPPFAIVDTLVEQVRNSTAIICVLRDRYGSSVFGDTESVSFLETEIYEAALFHRNAHFFLMEPFNSDPRLRGLLDLIEAVRPGIIPAKAVSKEKVLGSIKRVLDQTRKPRHPRWAISLRKLVGELAFRRGYPRPDIEFFDKVFRPVSIKPDKDHLNVLLSSIGNEESVEKRLTRMWIALRELSAAPYDQPAYREYLPFWDGALGAWASAASWYGLHGHLYAGRLAAVNSLLAIRSAMKPDWTAKDIHTHIQGTKGGRASEYYSIAKLAPTREKRGEYLELALSDLRDAIRSSSGDVSGYLAIQGHVHLLGGQPRLALADFEAVKRACEMNGDRGRAGEAIGDLGLAHMRLGDLRRARSLFHESADMLMETGRYPFAVRVRKRLARAHLLTGHPLLALSEIRAAYELAQQRQIYDQITPLMEAVHDLAARLGAWNR